MGLFDFLKKKNVEQDLDKNELFVENNEQEMEVLVSENQPITIEEVEKVEKEKEETKNDDIVIEGTKKENSIFDEIKKDLEEIANCDETKTIDYVNSLNENFDNEIEEDEEIEKLIINDNIVFQSEIINICDEDEAIEKENFSSSSNFAEIDVHEPNIEKVDDNLNEDVIEITEAKSEPKKISIFDKLKKGLDKTKENILGGLDNVLGAFTKIDEDLFEELEETLIMADLGVETSVEIIEKLRERVKKERVSDVKEVKSLIIKIISEILEKNSEPLILEPPTIILVIGVNGVGKTTTIGKLTNKIISSGKSVQIAAADTFRAAAIDQLQVWADRNKVNLIKHQENSDPGAVVFDAVKSAKARKTDVLIIDTAGRLHNKKNLMEELGKINRIIKREYDEAHLEVFLTLDSTTGQNAMQQAKQFNEVTNITGLVLTKLDGTAKGGIVVAIKNELDVPVRFIGIGENIDDLEPFDSKMFASALFE